MSRAFLERTDRLVHDVLEWAVAGVLLAIAVICFAEVVLRYGLGRSFGWYDEFIGYLLVWLTFLAAVLAHQHGQHIGIDNFLKRLPHWGQRFAGFFNHLLGDSTHTCLQQLGGVAAFRHFLLAVPDHGEQLVEDSWAGICCLIFVWCQPSPKMSTPARC